MQTNASKNVRRSITVATVVTAGLATLGGVASADPTSSTGSVVANVGVTSGITMTGVTPSFELDGAPGDTATATGAVHLNVETNDVNGYSVTVRSATSALLPALSGNTDSIPVNVLTVNGGSGGYQALSASTSVTVHSQSARSANGGDALSNDYRMRIPVVNADVYSATLNYVASAL